MNTAILSETVDSRWRGLYKLGSISAIIISILLLGDFVVYGVTYAVWPNLSTPIDYFKLFSNNWLVGLLNFDLLGMISYLLYVPVILTLYFALRRKSETIMIVATVLFVVGIAAFFASNTAFPMLTLSNQYAVAKTEAERAMIEAASLAMITLFNQNAFMVSYAIVSAAWTMIASVMLRSNLFNPITAWAGILGGGSGVIAVITGLIDEVLGNTSEVRTLWSLLYFSLPLLCSCSYGLSSMAGDSSNL